MATKKEAAPQNLIVPKPRKGQTILARKGDTLKWFTPEAWALVPASLITDLGGNKRRIEKQGYLQVDPKSLQEAPPRID